MREINTAVVHYSATRPEDNVTAETIKKWHEDRGFSVAPGYHKIIYRDGTVIHNLDWQERGIHVRGHNSDTVGICWVGGLVTEDNIDQHTLTDAQKRIYDRDGEVGVDTRTPEQIEALDGLLRDLKEEYPHIRVLGHKDLVATQCPGYDVRKDIEERGVFDTAEDRIGEVVLEPVRTPVRRITPMRTGPVEVIDRIAEEQGVSTEELRDAARVIAEYVHMLMKEVPWYRRAITVLRTLRDLLNSL